MNSNRNSKNTNSETEMIFSTNDCCVINHFELNFSRVLSSNLKIYIHAYITHYSRSSVTIRLYAIYAIKRIVNPFDKSIVMWNWFRNVNCFLCVRTINCVYKSKKKKKNESWLYRGRFKRYNRTNASNDLMRVKKKTTVQILLLYLNV